MIMAVTAQKQTLAEYLAWENQQAERHEFYRGEVFAMVGVRRVHGLVAGNLFAALKTHLKGGPCRAFIESLKLQVGNDMLFYPDVFVTCHPQDLKTDMVFRHPSLIVEVLSDSTQAYDRDLKFSAYRRIEDLQEYVLIDPDNRRVEVFRRNERQLFELHDQSGLLEMHLASVDLRLPMSEVFDGVEEPSAPA
jgi:Uma2 family endonuclease